MPNNTRIPPISSPFFVDKEKQIMSREWANWFLTFAGNTDTSVQYNSKLGLSGDSTFVTDGAGSVEIDGDQRVDNLTANVNQLFGTGLIQLDTGAGSRVVISSEVGLGAGILNIDGNNGVPGKLQIEAPNGLKVTMQGPASLSTGYTLVLPTALSGSNRVLTDTDGAGTLGWTNLSANVTASGTPVDNQIAVWTNATTIEGTAGFTWDGSDHILYEAVNDGNPQLRIGAVDAEELHVQTVYDSAAQTLNYVLFTTDVASVTADKGLYRFNVDGTDILDIDDGGLDLKTGFTYAINGTNVLSSTTLGSGVTASSLTSVGTLTTLTVDDITINGNTISSAGASTLAITPTAGQAITFDGTVTLDAGVIAGATSITSTSFVGDVTGNCTGTAATVTGATQAAITTCSNLVTVGALASGSIAVGFGAIDNGTNNITTGGILKVDVDGTAENAAGSLTLGAGNDAGIFFDGTDLQVLTNGAGASGIILDAEDDTLEIKGSGVLQATFDTSGLNLVSGDGYSIAGTSVLNATTLGSGVTASSLTSVGTIATGTWSATAVGATKGGTGLSTVAAGSALCANSVDTVVAVTSTVGTKILTNTTGTITWETAAGGGNVSNVGTPLDNQIAVWTGATTIEGTAGFTWDGSDHILYEAVNEGNPQLRLGATDAEELHIQSVYDTTAQTLNYVLFTTDVASVTADKGLYRFNVDGTDIVDIDDGGVDVKSGKTYAIAGTDVLSGTTLGAGVTASSLTSVGTITTGTWTATDIAVADGGTGRSTATAYAVLCGGTTSTAAHQSIAGVGTSGQVLTSNGASNLPTFQNAAAADGNDWVLISSATASASAQIVFTGLTSTYGAYVIVMTDVVAENDGVVMFLRTSTDGGASYDSGVSDYGWVLHYVFTVATVNTDSADSEITMLGAGLGNAANESLNGKITLYRPSSATYTHVSWEAVYDESTLGGMVFETGAGQRLSAADVDAVRLAFSTGNITSGEFRLYGLLDT